MLSQTWKLSAPQKYLVLCRRSSWGCACSSVFLWGCCRNVHLSSGESIAVHLQLLSLSLSHAAESLVQVETCQSCWTIGLRQRTDFRSSCPVLEHLVFWPLHSSALPQEFCKWGSLRVLQPRSWLYRLPICIGCFSLI